MQSDKKTGTTFLFLPESPFFVLFVCFLACLFICANSANFKVIFLHIFKSNLFSPGELKSRGSWAKDYKVITGPYTDQTSVCTIGIPMKNLKKSVTAVRLFRSWERGSTDLPDKTDFELKRGKSALEEFTLKY